VRQSSLLLRFGQLTPAFVLQVLAPLLLVFVGHACVARERESGTLRILLAQGVGGRHIVLGKLLALSGFAALALLPAWLALAWLAVSGQSAWMPVLLLGGSYSVWLLLWSLGVVLVSCLFPRGRDALLGLLALWAVLVILLPRWVPDLANMAVALPTRFETEILVERQYLELGDAHNPNDPKFAEFRDKVLQQYGVERVEDLPVNFKGLIAAEGERQSSELFNRYARASFERQAEQNLIVDRFQWLSPTLALRRLSMSAAGTDLNNYRRFLEQGEAYRTKTTSWTTASRRRIGKPFRSSATSPCRPMKHCMASAPQSWPCWPGWPPCWRLCGMAQAAWGGQCDEILALGTEADPALAPVRVRPAVALAAVHSGCVLGSA